MSKSLSPTIPDTLVVQQTEKQLWEIIRSIPGLNVSYGTVRCIVYVIKKDDKESLDSAIGAAKGALQTAVVTAGVVTAPITIPLAAGGTLTGIASKTVTDLAEIIVFFVTNAEQFHDKDSDERESVVYDKIKDVTGIGALYSAVRVPIYLLKKNRQRSVESGINFVANSGDTAVQIGVSMIPNIDEQLQKLIQRTARSAVKYLAKKVKEQVTRETLTLELGLKTIAKMENDCQTIMEATTGETTAEEQTNEKTTNSCSQKQCDTITREKPSKNIFSICCCFCKRRTGRKVKPRNSQNAPPTQTADKQHSESNASHGHLLILTE